MLRGQLYGSCVFAARLSSPPTPICLKSIFPYLFKKHTPGGHAVRINIRGITPVPIIIKWYTTLKGKPVLRGEDKNFRQADFIKLSYMTSGQIVMKPFVSPISTFNKWEKDDLLV